MDVRWCITLFIVHTVNTEVVEFESGKTFKTVDLSTIADPQEHEDPKNTGGFLFDYEADNNDKKRFSLNVMTYSLRSETSRYFRSHPVFVSCLQKIITSLQNQGTQLMISSGYKTRSDTGGSTGPQDLYARAGTGAQLGFRPGVTGDILHIARAALKFCPPIFGHIQRDVGVILMKNRVHVHMTGRDDTTPHYSVDGYTGMTSLEFVDWAQQVVNEGLDPVQSPDCSKFSGLESGSTFPAGVAGTGEVVGSVDQPVTRDTPVDYNRLVQYLGTNVVFTNPEGSAAWCGEENTPCVDCSAGPVGNHPSTRCANRMMTARMYNFLKSLQKLVRNNLSGKKLKVLKAFDEPYAGNSEYSVTSLHSEGRQLTIQLNTDNSIANLKTVTKYAQCLGVDFVKHNGDHVVLAVKKMKGYTAQKVQFPQGIQLLAVEPPHDKMADYRLPVMFSEKEEERYPLFDSSGQETTLLAPNTPLQMFLSKDSKLRYFRLDPRIPKCYSLIHHHLNKHNPAGEAATTLEVSRGFLSITDQLTTLSEDDERYNTFTLGSGMEITFVHNPRGLHLSQLVLAAIDSCSPLFYEAGEYVGVGLYKDSVFVDVRDEFEVWTDGKALIPEEHASVQDYRSVLETRNQAAISNRIVDPDDLKAALTSAYVPRKQSPDYSHQTPPGIVRRRRSAPNPDDCVPETDTPFCLKTKNHRDRFISLVWKEVNRKWHYHDEAQVKEALETCLGLCGTCMEGVYYEEKLAHCDNLLHWVPFKLMNDDTVSNIFPRDNQELRKHACQGHCIEKAELFHLVINAVEAVYRPDPGMSVEEDLYPATENPSPLLRLLGMLYATHAQGEVRLWVEDDNDVISLRDALKVLMLYNKNVTGVQVFCPGNKDAVAAALENLKREWATTGYPPYTRQFIAPFTIDDLPPLVRKRDVDTSIRERLIEQRFGRDAHWAMQEL